MTLVMMHISFHRLREYLCLNVLVMQIEKPEGDAKMGRSSFCLFKYAIVLLHSFTHKVRESINNYIKGQSPEDNNTRPHSCFCPMQRKGAQPPDVSH
jgi:hypothetical protein